MDITTRLRAASLRRCDLLRVTSLAASISFLGAVVHLAHSGSDFYGDDILNLLLLRNAGFWKAIATPIDVHLAPLQRALGYAIHALSPMNFGLAVGVLAAFHLGGTIYLHAALRLLGLCRWADLVSWIYLTSPAVFVLIAWWSAGAHRLPYVFCGLGATYHYLQCRRTASVLHQLATIALVLTGIAFYTKGFMIPIVLLAVEMALRVQLREPASSRALATLLASNIMALGLMITARYFREMHGGLNFDLHQISQFSTAGLRQVMIAPLLPLLPIFGSYDPSTPPSLVFHASVRLYSMAGVVWLLLVAATCLGRVRNLAVWGLALGVMLFEAGGMATSPKARFLGTLVFLAPRFALESLWVPLLFASIALSRASLIRRVRVIDAKPVALMAGSVIIVLWSAVSYNMCHWMYTNNISTLRNSREYLLNLRNDLGAAMRESENMAFIDVPCARPLMSFYSIPSSRLLPLFGIDAVYYKTRAMGLRKSPPTESLFEIGPEGHVTRVTPR